jgi:hypothetical protein
MIVYEVNMNRETVRLILTEESGMKEFVPRWCPEIPQSNNALRVSAQFLTSKCITLIPRPPFSPDLTPCDLFLFQKEKSAVKGHHFESTEDIQKAVTQILNGIAQAPFQECYKQRQYRWKSCVQLLGM